MFEKIKSVKTVLKNNINRVENLSLYLLASILSGIIGVFFNPFLAANLSSLDYSIIGYFGSFAPLFTPILNFSLISYYVRKYFKIAPEKRQETLNTIVSTLIIWGAISSVLIVVLFFIYTSLNKVELPFYPFAIMSIAQLVFNNFLLIYQVNCRMQADAKRYFKITMAASLLTVLFSVFLVIIFKYGAVGRMSATLASSIIIAFISIKRIKLKLTINFNILKEAISFGWPVSISYIIQYFLFGIDISLLERLNDVTNMGLYVVAVTIAGYLSILYTGLAQTFEPDLYKAVSQYDYKKIIRIVVLITTILIPFVLVFTLLAKPVIAILTYNRYTEAYQMARVLSLGVISTYLMVAIEGIINAFGYTKTAMMNKVISAILVLILYNHLINNYQFIGAAWGRVMAPFIVFIIGLLSLFFLKPKITRMRYAEKN